MNIKDERVTDEGGWKINAQIYVIMTAKVPRKYGGKEVRNKERKEGQRKIGWKEENKVGMNEVGGKIEGSQIVSKQGRKEEKMEGPGVETVRTCS